jgi:prepilin-type N-terminal cleavage/methylation domain-containing protein
MKKTRIRRKDRARKCQAGMTLIELLIAMLVLAVGLSGIMAMVVTALASNGRNRTDTTATLLSQMVIEQLANVPAGTDTVISVTDCTGTQWNINTAGAAAPAGAGAALEGVGNDNPPFWVGSDINFNIPAAYGAAPGNGYGMRYITCGINADQQIAYDVRWNITKDASGFVKTVTVATRNTGAANSSLTQFAIPVQLKTILGN